MNTNDDELQREIDALSDLRNEIAGLPDPHPSAAADRRFTEMLAAHTGTARSSGNPRHLRPAALLAVAATLLLLVFGLGWYFGSAESTAERQLAATRTLMLELMQDRRSSQRMQAATVSLSIEVADPEVIANLGLLLRTDPNTNVRLAALDALRRFSDDPSARREMLDAMAGAPPPAVQVQLLETLVSLNEKRVLPYLEDIISNDSIPRRLRDAAELGTFKLI
ncbi:HEAT repeat domain-containing protein [Lewinella sp. JB7]|uniref:HEAT repeat domain-containing protein n=1 Tax=Lewinella sp. JB7 TaxID=2962887 RepID=UPI0020C9D1F5|nr:HEAT repeat domain-containing protein [Lewinella sp. JB7]MCP9236906.1 HEAT repeat domain-containing protein [Lewinella sp. JB7]